MKNVFIGILGVAVFALVDAIVKFLFGLLIALPVIGNLLSYPAPPMVYALVSSLFLTTGITYFIVEKLSKRSEEGKNSAFTVLAILVTLVSLLITIASVSIEGLSLISLSYLSFIVCGVFFFYAGREEIRI